VSVEGKIIIKKGLSESEGKMATDAAHQDMPPEGGYKPINYARIPAKKYFSGKIFGCCCH
jgi:hypothetical protein